MSGIWCHNGSQLSTKLSASIKIFNSSWPKENVTDYIQETFLRVYFFGRLYVQERAPDLSALERSTTVVSFAAVVVATEFPWTALLQWLLPYRRFQKFSLLALN